MKIKNKKNIDKFLVPISRLRWHCDCSHFKFKGTEEVTPLQEFIGQDRASSAIDFGLNVDKDGYNIFMIGLTGTGKMSLIQAYLKKIVEKRKKEEKNHTIKDWCYVYNFSDPDKPVVLELSKGQGRMLKWQMDELIFRIKAGMSKAFKDKEYLEKKKAIVDEHQNKHRKLVEDLNNEAKKYGFIVQSSNMGIITIPVKNGEPLTQEQYVNLTEPERNDIEKRRTELTKYVNDTVQKSQDLEIEMRKQIKELDRKVGEYTVSKPLKDLMDEYKNSPQVLNYLTNAKNYILEHLSIFQQQEPSGALEELNLGGKLDMKMTAEDPFLAFRVNVFVDNSNTDGPPIIIESNPTYSNVFGRMEKRSFMGAYFTDHTMLKPGAIMSANGGYLVLNARDVLTNPGVWDALKRAIRTKEAQIEDLAEFYGFVAQGLKPNPIPLNVKIIMTGNEWLYQMLSAYEEDFREIFKVKAEFDSEIDKNTKNMQSYAAFISGFCEKEKLKHFDREAVAMVIEYASKLVADQQKLSSRFGEIKDILIEACYWSDKSNSKRVEGSHVEKAINEQIYRSDLISQKINELIVEGTIMIDVKTKVAGQVNGLAVYDLGDFAFGKPSRITARTFMGRGGIVNIEREADMSGRTHNKGVLILSGYLGSKYAQDKPLTLSATLCFEQSYEGVDGDSASSTELYAILSSLSDVPIKQSIAVTGSINQKGEIQPIGGVNQKIEGYFEVCKAMGLNGQQGVMIPYQNVKNLMLKKEIVDAVQKKKFHIWEVKTCDEGIEILTGMPAGKKGKDGCYPHGTINYLVNKKLDKYAEGLKAAMGDEEKTEKKNKGKKIEPHK